MEDNDLEFDPDKFFGKLNDQMGIPNDEPEVEETTEEGTSTFNPDQFFGEKTNQNTNEPKSNPKGMVSKIFNSYKEAIKKEPGAVLNPTAAGIETFQDLLTKFTQNDPNRVKTKDLDPRPLMSGIATGSTAGFADEGVAGATAAIDLASGNTPTINNESTLDKYKRIYETYRNANRNKLAELEQQAPGDVLLGDLAAGLAVPTPGANALASKLPTKLTPAIKSALTSGPVGFVEGVGRSEADTMEGVIDDGVNTGLLTSAGGLVLGKAAGKFSEPNLQKELVKTQQTANKQALQSIGANASDFKKEYKIGKSSRSGVDQAKGSGQTLLDENLISMKGDPSEVTSAINTRLDDVWNQRIQPTTQKLDQKMKSLDYDRDISPELDLFQKQLEKNASDMAEKFRYEGKDITDQLDSATQAQAQILADIRSVPPEQMVTKISEIRRNLDSLVDWQKPDKMLTGPEQLRKANAMAVRDFLNNLSEKADSSLGKELSEHNKTYSDLLFAQGISGRDLAKDSAQNKFFTPGDFFLTSGVGMVGGPIASVGAYGGKKLAERYTGKELNQLVSTFRANMNNSKAKTIEEILSNYQSSLAKPISQSGPALGAGAGVLAPTLMDKQTPIPVQEQESVFDSSPDKLQEGAMRLREDGSRHSAQVADHLERAATSKDMVSRNAALFAMLQDPFARAKLNPVDEEEQLFPNIDEEIS